MSAISVKVIQLIVAGAASRGVEPARLLAHAAIEPTLLADPDGRVPRATEVPLWYEAARLTGDDAFGLHLSEAMPIDGLGVLGFAVRSSPTLGEAYQRVVRYLRLVASGPRVELIDGDDEVCIRHVAPDGPPAPARHAVEFLLCNLLGIARHGVDPAITARAVHFRHRAPADVTEHHRLLGERVRFGQLHDELLLPRALLDHPQRMAEPALCEALDQHLATLLQSLPEPSRFLDRVRGLMAGGIGHGEPSLDAIAARMHMSPRSLQRRLREEGSSLSSLLNQLRAELAVRYLSESRDSISEIGFMLGFSEVSTFHRAFRRWTGVTPAAYRRKRGPARREETRAKS